MAKSSVKGAKAAAKALAKAAKNIAKTAKATARAEAKAIEKAKAEQVQAEKKPSECVPQEVIDDLMNEVPLEVRSLNGVTREDWKALDAKDPISMSSLPVQTVIFSCTNSQPCKTTEECIAAVQRLQRRHLAKGYSDIKYNFMIGADGYIYEGRGWEVEPERVKKFAKLWHDSIHIGFLWRKPRWRPKYIRDPERDEHVLIKKIEFRETEPPPPTPEMWHMANDLIEYAMKNRFLTEDVSWHNTEFPRHYDIDGITLPFKD